MIPAEITGYYQYLSPENLATLPAEFNIINMPSSPTSSYSLTYLNDLINNNYSSSFIRQDLMMSNNSTSDEDPQHHHHQSIIIVDERKQRRMLSNRESARRSRMRKQRHLDELWSQVIRLRNENNCLIDKLNRVSETQDSVLKENSKLKEEASELRQLVCELKSNKNSDDDNNFVRKLSE
ncbi:PREDICTED: basic leucine zipper 43 [Brassica oleracea var. oleracea]|uniref:BZIP domain-containing protein n=1 Tax=Brassica oleracea var. oleracea TaxID=109376 RepID=A0A0D3AVT9_BRAOL|nr:PREDICTED: basic leucine zipper 43 [Brassica oleracea var. oleracea]